MKSQLKHLMITGLALMLLAAVSGAQVVASHSSSLGKTPAAASQPAAAAPAIAPARPIARVNGALLTDRDLAREIQTIFPYTKTHNGVPKSMEPDMVKGALEMIIFEELVYQEAVRRQMTVSPERMKAAETHFRKQFASEQELNQVLQAEVHGSRELMREKIRRSLLIQDLLKTDVIDRSKVSLIEARAYYQKNKAKYAHPERFSIQTISFIPPADANADAAQEARKHALDAEKAAKATKTYQEFGLLAEKVSEDDWHVNMGDRQAVDRDKLPPPVADAALKMKTGEVSELIQLGNAYTLFRLNEQVPAGTTPFEEVKGKLMTDLEKQKNEQLRGDLNKKLRKTAKIEVL
jgi:parvulin-like peptidyl-prolyl isomerase